MASGVLTGTNGRIIWSSTPNTANNTSRVTVQFQVIYPTAYTNRAVTAQILTSTNGVTLKSTSGGVQRSFPANTYITVHTQTLTVAHGASGYGGIFVEGWEIKGISYASGNIVLDKITPAVSLTSAPDFTDEDNPTISYSVASKSNTTLLQACISLTGAEEDIAYRDIDINETSYTFNLTEEEREILRNATTNGSASRSVRFYIKSTVNGNTSFKYLEKTFTVVNAEPTLSVFLLDTNEVTTALTGDSLASLIKGYSNVSYETNTSGVKGATIVEQSAVNGSTTLTTGSGTFEAIESGTFTFTATDNRGLTTTKEITLNVIDYFKPTCEHLAEFDMSTETADIKIVANGEWCSKHFGAVHNELNIEYRYKVGNGEWSEWSGSNYITDNNTYKITFTIENVDYTKAHTIQCRAVDLLDSTMSAEYTIKQYPVFDWGENDFRFNVPVHFAQGFTAGDSSGDSIVETGTEPMGTNGTWYWSKWSSGKVECYGIRNYGNMSFSNAWGYGYYSAHYDQDLPNVFDGAPDYLDITVHSAQSGFAWIARSGQATESSTGEFTVVRFSSGTLQQVHIGFRVIGKWK